MTANWTESYFYDRYGNKQGTTAGGITANSQAVPSDGFASQSYDSPSNRINTSGYLYDLMGNLTKGQDASGNWQTYEYDQAGRMLRIRDASNNILETHFYAADRNRYAVENSTQRTYYAWGGASVLEEYTEPLAGNTPTYSKSYIYAGSRLLSTYTNNNGAETLQLQHPDRLGTKLVTNPQSATQFEQSTLPFGTSLDAETSGATNERFTSYDRSTIANLDYAVNRSYSAGQSRFTSVDPAQDGSNLYAYAGNDPINKTDPTGLNASSDPMGTSYYVDGFLSDARTAWAHINAGNTEAVFSTVGGVVGDVYAQYTGSLKEPRWVGIRQAFHAWNNDGARIVYLSDEKDVVKKIQDIVAYATSSDECTKAFEAVGATPIGNQLNNITLVTQRIFTEHLYDANWTMGSNAGEDMRNIFSANSTTSDVTFIGKYRDTGHRFMGITEAAINEKIDYLAVSIIHAFVHSGDIEGKKIGYFSRTWDDMMKTGYNPPDLHYLGRKYDNIITACTKTGKSRQPKAELYESN